MLRALVIALLLCACDEEDPATSQHCKDIRLHYLQVKLAGDKAAQAAADIAARHDGHGGAYDTSYLTVLAQIENENWECFK